MYQFFSCFEPKHLKQQEDVRKKTIPCLLCIYFAPGVSYQPMLIAQVVCYNYSFLDNTKGRISSPNLIEIQPLPPSPSPSLSLLSTSRKVSNRLFLAHIACFWPKPFQDLFNCFCCSSKSASLSLKSAISFPLWYAKNLRDPSLCISSDLFSAFFLSRRFLANSKGRL